MGVQIYRLRFASEEESIQVLKNVLMGMSEWRYGIHTLGYLHNDEVYRPSNVRYKENGNHEGWLVDVVTRDKLNIAPKYIQNPNSPLHDIL